MMNVVSAVTGNRMVRILNQFIYLFKENRSGYSWPQTIPPLITSPYDTHRSHACGHLFSPPRFYY